MSWVDQWAAFLFPASSWRSKFSLGMEVLHVANLQGFSSYLVLRDHISVLDLV